MERVRLAVAGCGYIAVEDYFPVLIRGDVQEKVELVAVCDTVEPRVRQIADRFGANAWYTDYEAMLQRPDIDVVAILTPIQVHFAQAAAAIRSGRHTYVQKTMTTTEEEAGQLIELARHHGVKICASPGQMLDSSHRNAQRLIRDGVIGKICFARGHGGHPGHENQELFGIDPSWYYGPGGGPVRDVAVYPLHSLTGLIGPARRVTAFSGIAIPDRSWNGRKLDVRQDDNTGILLDFGDGVIGMVEGSYCFRRCNTPQFEFYGSTGVIQLGGWTQPSVPLEVYSDQPTQGFRAGWYRPETPSLPNKPTVGDLLHLVDCVREDTEPIASAAHARHVIEIIEKAYESARTGTAMELSTTF
jgi:predicted dehydrogenase